MAHRDEVIKFIDAQDGEEFESYQIAKAIGCERNAVNFILRELEDRSLITKRVSGYYTYWRVNVSTLKRRRLMTRLWNDQLWH